MVLIRASRKTTPSSDDSRNRRDVVTDTKKNVKKDLQPKKSPKAGLKRY